jgi:hypothetical protein
MEEAAAASQVEALTRTLTQARRPKARVTNSVADKVAMMGRSS